MGCSPPGLRSHSKKELLGKCEAIALGAASMRGSMKRRRRHLGADEVDVLLDLRNPLAEDGEQLWDGGARVPEKLPALRLAGVKEGELCGRRGKKKDAETKVYCNANQNRSAEPVRGSRKSIKR